jgi:DNA-binding CsgD family transcriptional regulator
VGDGLEPLSRRERQVFRLLIVGYTNSEIAQLLHLSVRTVESHRANLQRKLALSTRAQLVSFALKRGLLTERRLPEIPKDLPQAAARPRADNSPHPDEDD